MAISDETLMAYADGELDAAARADVEAAMREDAGIAARVAAHRAMRETMRGAFAGVLAEPVPERLVAAARGRSSSVVDYAAARAAAQPRQGSTVSRRWQPAALAASLLLGLGAGYLTWHGSGALIESGAGGLVAGTALSATLSTQLSNDRSASAVAVAGLSFRSKSGSYCRTFSVNGSEPSSGLACREGARWRIEALARAPRADATQFRTAGSALSPTIRAAVEASIEGEPLDRAGEIAARDAGWSAR